MIWSVLVMMTLIGGTPVGPSKAVFAFDSRKACYEFAYSLVSKYEVFQNSKGQIVEPAGLCVSTKSPGNLPTNRGA